MAYGLKACSCHPLSTHRPRLNAYTQSPSNTRSFTYIQSSHNLLGFFSPIVRRDTWQVHNEQHIEILFLYTIPL